MHFWALTMKEKNKMLYSKIARAFLVKENQSKRSIQMRSKLQLQIILRATSINKIQIKTMLIKACRQLPIFFLKRTNLTGIMVSPKMKKMNQHILVLISINSHRFRKHQGKTTRQKNKNSKIKSDLSSMTMKKAKDLISTQKI